MSNENLMYCNSIIRTFRKCGLDGPQKSKYDAINTGLTGLAPRVTPGVCGLLFCLFHFLFDFVFTSLEIDWIKHAKGNFS